MVRRKTGILVKIGRVGFGTFYRIHIELKKGHHVVSKTSIQEDAFLSEKIPLWLRILLSREANRK